MAYELEKELLEMREDFIDWVSRINPLIYLGIVVFVLIGFGVLRILLDERYHDVSRVIIRLFMIVFFIGIPIAGLIFFWTKKGPPWELFM